MQIIKKSIINIVLLKLIIFLYAGCSINNTVYNLSYNTLNLGKNDNSIISIDFTNPIMKRYSSSCILGSYTLVDQNKKYGQLFIENIQLSETCHWNGLPSSFLEASLKNELKLKRIQTLESFSIRNYNFKTYKIDNATYLNLIYIFGGTSERFILDYEGKLYDKLLKTFKTDYENKYLNKKRFKGYYNSSLVEKNIINNYYKKESPSN